MDLTAEILDEDGISIDEDGFAAAMNEQKEKARKARKTTNYMGAVSLYTSPSIRPSLPNLSAMTGFPVSLRSQ